MNKCLAKDCRMGGLGCDNMTVVIVCFLNGQPYEKLAEKCKSSLMIKEETSENINNTCENSCEGTKTSYETDNCLSVLN